MRKFIFLIAIFVCGVLTMKMNSQSQAETTKAEEQVLRHIVMYKFKPEVTKEQVKEVVDAFTGLQKKIKVVKSIEAGENVSKEGKSEGFTHVFVVTFANGKDLESYLKDQAHLDYVNIVKDRREKVVVFDYYWPVFTFDLESSKHAR